MKKKVLVFLMCFCLMAGMMSGCGAEGTPASNNTDQTDNSTVNESNNTDMTNTTEPTEEPSPEPKNNAFAEEIGIQFHEPIPIVPMESEECEEIWTMIMTMRWDEWNEMGEMENLFSLPCFTYIKSNDDYVTETDQLKMRDIPAYYMFDIIDKSEPDADGNVTYTIGWRLFVTYGVDVKNTPWTLSMDGLVSDWGLFDYYTGTLLTPELNSSNKLNITWNDSTYHISDTLDRFDSPELFEVEWNDDVYVEWRQDLYYMEQITVPADYDGLVLFIDDGVTREDFDREGETRPKAGTVLNFEETNNYTFIRVNDYFQ